MLYLAKPIFTIPKTPSPSIPSPFELAFAIDRDGYVELNWKMQCCTDLLLGFVIDYRIVRKASAEVTQDRVYSINSTEKNGRKAKRELNGKVYMVCHC